METNLSSLINKNYDKPCLIIGPGPTMSEFPYKEFNGSIISIGDSAIRGKDLFTPDFWICSNSHFPVPEIDYHLKIINNFKDTTFLFAETELYGLLWNKSQEFLNKNLKVDWILFDERHFQGKNCYPKKKCCDLIASKNGVYTIQELVSKLYSNNKIAKRGGSVFEYALCLSLILGCNPIYIQGVDLPVSGSLGKPNFFEKGDLGQEYFVEKKNKVELESLYKKTFKDISIKAKELEKNKPSFNLLKKVSHRLKRYYNYFKNRTMGFSEVIDLILYNCSIYSEIAENNNKKIFYLSPNSSLKLVKNMNFKDPKDLNF